LAHEDQLAVNGAFIGPAMRNIARQPNASTGWQMMLFASYLKEKITG
jgi:hypothetical protein